MVGKYIFANVIENYFFGWIHEYGGWAYCDFLAGSITYKWQWQGSKCQEAISVQAHPYLSHKLESSCNATAKAGQLPKYSWAKAQGPCCATGSRVCLSPQLTSSDLRNDIHGY